VTSISVDQQTKTEFDELKPEGLTHDEFTQELLAAYRRDNGEIIDVDAIVERIEKRIATKIELAAYRGIDDRLDK
jgi:hypothetical protein